MVGQLNILNEWIPEEMLPGTIFVLDKADESCGDDDPYVAVLACPQCGTIGLLTRRQVSGVMTVICGSDTCPAQFLLRDTEIVPRKPM